MPTNCEKVMEEIARAGFLSEADKKTFSEDLARDSMSIIWIRDQLEQRMWYPEAKEEMKAHGIREDDPNYLKLLDEYSWGEMHKRRKNFD